MTSTRFQPDDGGREAAGFKGSTGDCVSRAIAIATELPYERVYNDLFEANKARANGRRDFVARRLQERGTSPRQGVYRKVYDDYLKSLGWKFVPTMSFGSGCQVHLRADELPRGRIIARLSRHLSAVIDGVVHDTHNPSRGGTRCVYGYYIKEEA